MRAGKPYQYICTYPLCMSKLILLEPNTLAFLPVEGEEQCVGS